MINHEFLSGAIRIWETTVLRLNRLISTSLLFFFYFIIVYPTALLAHLLRKDPLRLRFKAYTTFWDSPPSGSHAMHHLEDWKKQT